MPVRRPITFEDIARRPGPGANVPASVRFSPGGRLVTYLYSSEGTLTTELWAYDLESGREWRLLEPPEEVDEKDLSREEQLRRERQRQLTVGVTGYAWSEECDTLLVRVGGETLVRRGLEGEWRRVGEGLLDPRLSRDGSRVAFVQDAELYSLDLADPASLPVRLTHDASPADEHGDRVITNGLAEFVAQEEMGRSAGFWWSRDGKWLAFEQVDHSPVPLYLIPHPGTDEVDVEAHRYPFAGEANVRWRLGVVAAASGPVRWLPMPEEERYLARVHWTPDGCILVQLQSRDQTHLEVRRIDPQTGTSRFLWADEVSPWVNLTDDLRFVGPESTVQGPQSAAVSDQSSVDSRQSTGPRPSAVETDMFAGGRGSRRATVPRGTVARQEPRPPMGGAEDPSGLLSSYEILWSSERTGRRELYRYSPDGTLLWRVSGGDVHIDCVRGVDEAGGWVYVEGWDATPLERHLFRIPLAGGDAECITQTPGCHTCVLSEDGSHFVDVFSSVTEPPSATLRRIDGTPVARLQHDALPDPRLAELELPAPEFREVAADDGTLLYGALYRPRRLAPGAKAPVVVSVYGGPHAQTVTNSWGMAADLRAQYLAQEGFLVLKLDNRGSPRRGLAFEGAIAGNLGDLEVRDQAAGVRSLASVPEADLERVGVYGWSYGGYMALMCLARAPEVFHAAVAGAPVTHWDGYDTHYTERYMGLPQANPEGYQVSSVMAHAGAIRGRLLVIHGMIDENVHFRHTGRLIQLLNREGIPYEIFLMPEERHGPRSEKERAFLERRVAQFLRGS